MQPTPITHGREALTPRSFPAQSLPLVAKADGAAPAQGPARSQRELVQWSLMLCPEWRTRRAR
jgi:hypothetical protein